MRFSAALHSSQPSKDLAGEGERAHCVAEPFAAYPAPATAAAAPWPPGEPPEDLDQRVRSVGEW
jgi:hypothetical protein